jgi:alpha-D-ribose 1-methylphosphonate 5-triphosphate synthase subunit PhnI
MAKTVFRQQRISDGLRQVSPGGQQQSPTYDFKHWLRCQPN